jgi:hypothetical protein
VEQVLQLCVLSLLCLFCVCFVLAGADKQSKGQTKCLLGKKWSWTFVFGGKGGCLLGTAT